MRLDIFRKISIAFRLIWSAIRHGEWEIGWRSWKGLKGKPYLEIVTGFYDGHYWYLFLGPFYLGVAYVW